ncbi:MAG: prepilin-type N-terminal cleavage/methylation domain-containing protein [Clostridia bacterium]|nr:prepilin-type N-terminal cleavage/methylation domain-containing protein [Clostridia bacterium]
MIMTVRLKNGSPGFKKQKKKNSKKAFTLVELVIVIAILAILAAIAVPVITTIINSGKLSVLESDCQTVEVAIKEAMATSKAGIKATYNSKNVRLATVSDVLKQNDIDLEVMSVREIGHYQYAIYWDKNKESAYLNSAVNLQPFDLDQRLYQLEKNSYEDN